MAANAPHGVMAACASQGPEPGGNATFASTRTLPALQPCTVTRVAGSAPRMVRYVYRAPVKLLLKAVGLRR